MQERRRFCRGFTNLIVVDLSTNGFRPQLLEKSNNIRGRDRSAGFELLNLSAC